MSAEYSQRRFANRSEWNGPETGTPRLRGVQRLRIAFRGPALRGHQNFPPQVNRYRLRLVLSGELAISDGNGAHLHHELPMFQVRKLQSNCCWKIWAGPEPVPRANFMCYARSNRDHRKEQALLWRQLRSPEDVHPGRIRRPYLP